MNTQRERESTEDKEAQSGREETINKGGASCIKVPRRLMIHMYVRKMKLSAAV